MVVDNALVVDDPFVLEESVGTSHKSPRVGKNVREFEAGAKWAIVRWLVIVLSKSARRVFGSGWDL